MSTLTQFWDGGFIFILILLHIKFPIVDVILAEVWNGGAAEEIKASLQSATSKSCQLHFLGHDKPKVLVLCQWLGRVALANKVSTQQ